MTAEKGIALTSFKRYAGATWAIVVNRSPAGLDWNGGGHDKRERRIASERQSQKDWVVCPPSGEK